MALHRGRAEDGTHARPDPIVVIANPTVASDLVPPRHRLHDDPVPPDVAYQLTHDELLLDGNARLNLATFVTTWMEPQAVQLMAECADKNMIDKDEYPQTAELESRCVRILADLWHATDRGDPVGCSTTGSSEACMLAGLALKRRWTRRQTGGEARPNLVFGANAQVCWEKFCNYFEVEPRVVPLEGERFHLTATEAAAHCDAGTIGVVAILGSTLDGSYEPVADIAAALDELEATSGINVPIHVDGASGAMIAPFLDPDLAWDFRIPRVASVNTSGHKYGLVYPGIGWVVWRDHDALPGELVFKVNYLGGEMPTFTLNFSRPGSQVAAQYYMFLRLGREGYTAVQRASRQIAMSLAERISDLGPYRVLTRGDQLPVFAFATAPDVSEFTVFDVARGLKERGWLVPAYAFPANREDLDVLRIVCRNGFTADMADLLLRDLRATTDVLTHGRGHPSEPDFATAFHH
jgi:glutamate decarboxylase